MRPTKLIILINIYFDLLIDRHKNNKCFLIFHMLVHTNKCIVRLAVENVYHFE